MRLTALLLLSLFACWGCGSPRERECRVLMPRLDEAEVATSIVSNTRPDVTHTYALLASRSAAAARWLESASIETEELRRDRAALLEALERHAAAAKRGDAALHRLGFHMADGGARPGPVLAKLYAPGSAEKPPFVGEALTLENRCGFMLVDAKGAADRSGRVDDTTRAPEGRSECSALSAVVARFLAPAEGIPASAHVRSCMADVEAIHSTDTRVEEALRRLESLVRDVAALVIATTVDGPAVDLVAQLATLIKAVGEQQAAHKEVAATAAAMRATCVGPTGARPRGDGP
jgi:HAMP domain-containing protein